SRLLRRTYPGNVQVSFTYSPTGRRLTAVDSRGTTTYGYNTRDRVTSLVYPDGRSLEYAYDAAGNRTALTANVASRTLTTSYTYLDLNRLDTVTDPNGGVYAHHYDANGNRESLLFPNGVATTYAYNAKNQLLNISTVNNAGTTLVSFAYTLTPTGNRTKIVEHDGVTRNYAYDNLYRLTDEHVQQGTAPDSPTAWRNQFAYDPVGNRLEQLRQTENGTPQPVVYTYDDRDRYLTENGISGPVTYAWDANGNQTAKSGVEGATYVWDIENRLVRVELVNGTVVEHTYDADGTRIRARTTPASGASTTIDFLVDPWHQTSARGGPALSQVVAETDEADTLTNCHIRGNDLLASLRPQVDNSIHLIARHLHSEGLGTIRSLTDENGAVTDRYALEAFGSLVDHQGYDPNAYLFAGELLDRDTGFYYLRARWMRPGAARFVSEDPFPARPGYSLFSYAASNPANTVDPLGLFELSVAALNVSTAIAGSLGTLPAVGTVRGLATTGIFLEGHTVLVGLPFLDNAYHVLIKVVPKNQKKWRTARGDRYNPKAGSRLGFATLGAGPQFNFPPFGRLISNWNRDRDVNAAKGFTERIASTRNEDEVILLLEALDSAYADDLPYDGYPKPGSNGYNSGSFATGLLNAAGIPLPAFLQTNLDDFPGAEKPVPPEAFGVGR
ncbi:MAG: RHS repeat-associated core domain-containing protein, partial [Thermoanaerobaculia bacterium]